MAEKGGKVLGKTTCHFGELWYCLHNGVLGTEVECLGGGLVIRS